MDEVLQNPVFQLKLSELLVEDWFDIGINLEVKERSLISIRSDFVLYQKQKDKAYEMIKKWFNYDENPTFEKLQLAILKIEKKDLLKEVKDLANEFLNESLNSPSNTSERNSSLNSGGFSTMPLALPEDVTNTGIPTYTFNSNPCGLCVILCNSSFEKSAYRRGASVDVQTLSETFLKLNFKVKTEENKTKSQMYDIIRKCGNEKDVNCFVCFISSHGKLETVFGSDEEPLTFEEMRSAINDNDANLLIGKPKIFFIQACQGENLLEMYNDPEDSRYLRKPDSKPKSVKATVVPKVADYCFSVATTPGHYAWRIEKGTVYFQTLCRIINNLLETNKRISLMSILLQLSREMCEDLKIVSTQAENPNRLEANLCNIAYYTLRDEVYLRN